MKKLIAAVTLILSLTLTMTACSSHCQECDQPVYQDGLCEYHYALQALQNAAEDAAGDLIDGLLG